MRGFGAVCISLLLSAIPATASDQNLKEELGKIGSAYEQYFSNKDAAGITSLYTKNYMRVTEDGVVDNARYYENAFKAGVSRLDRSRRSRFSHCQKAWLWSPANLALPATARQALP
ncbi:hypothetical protein ACVWXN_002789 [Bradyrhizobium sp. i1.4.4]